MENKAGCYVPWVPETTKLKTGFDIADSTILIT